MSQPYAVFIHGVPETPSIWLKVMKQNARPSLALPLPGFVDERPEGFGATKDEYVDWLAAELAKFEEPVDLVGHDWGAGLTYRIATAHPQLIRSWVADIGNLVHPDYQWHDFAKIWQTPGEGEAFIEAQNAQSPDERAAGYEALFGLTAADALDLARGSNPSMGACILDLYRSAVPNAHAHWGPWSPTAKPGMVVHPADDPFGDEKMAAEVAAQLGARFEVLPGAGHFWPYQVPEAAGALLADFWSTLS